jgi:hypothetical protein
MVCVFRGHLWRGKNDTERNGVKTERGSVCFNAMTDEKMDGKKGGE